MPVAAIVTIALSSVLVLALAFYLIWVVVLLRRAVDTLGKITFGVRAIAHRTEPVGPLLSDVNADLLAVAEALEALTAPAAGTARAS